MKSYISRYFSLGLFAAVGMSPFCGLSAIDDEASFEAAKASQCVLSPGSPYGSWTRLQDPPFVGDYAAGNYPILLTDGSVMVQNVNFPATGEFWKYSPDSFGNYENGTWTQLASLDPNEYWPLYCGGAVLADGRVILAGGEYDGPFYPVVYTNKCAIYDPVLDQWEIITPPLFMQFNQIGDGSSVLLEDGRFMVGNANNGQAALLDLETMQWTEVGTLTNQCTNNEAGWTLLSDGRVLMVNCYHTAVVTTDMPGVGPFYSWAVNYSILNNVLTSPVTGTGAIPSPDSTACTPVNPLTGQVAIWDWAGPCGSAATVSNIQGAGAVAALGLLKRDSYMAGTVGQSIYFGLISEEQGSLLQNAVTLFPNMQVTVSPPTLTAQIYDPATGKWEYAGTPVEALSELTTHEIGPQVLRPDGTVFVPGSTGNTGIYDSNVGIWSAGPKLPVGPGSEGQLGCLDAQGVLLPNGNVLFASQPNYSLSSTPTHFFVFDGSDLFEQPATDLASDVPGFTWGMVLLPNGQVFATSNFGLDMEIYTPDDRRFNPQWAPKITKVDSKVNRGGTYRITGCRFNGMSQACFYGDENQNSTNYPLVRVTNVDTGHVTYWRTHHHSFMGVASDRCVHTYYDVPANQAPGKYKLEVVANGIPSKPVTIRVN